MDRNGMMMTERELASQRECASPTACPSRRTERVSESRKRGGESRLCGPPQLPAVTFGRRRESCGTEPGIVHFHVAKIARSAREPSSWLAS